MTSRIHRTFVVAGIVAGAVSPHAHASPGVTATALDGRALTSGSIVTQGTREGDLCTFAEDGVTLTIPGEGAGAISLRADESCRLVVDFLGVPTTVAATNADIAAESRRPKVVDDSAVAVPVTAGPAEDAVAVALDIAASAASTEQKLVKLSQTIYSPGGIRQYEDSIDVQYLRDKRTGAMSGVEAWGGYCLGDLVSDTVYTPITEIRNCFYKTLYNGPERVGFLTGGYYRQVVGGIETDSRKLTEIFNVYRNQQPTRTCSTGGSLPVGWYNYCFLDVN